MPEDFQRRLPSVEREVASIRPEDIRVSLVGMVIDKDGTSMVLDDGTGKITVRSDQPLVAEVNQRVRVFGRVIPMEQGAELQGDVVQDMRLLDLELWTRLKSLRM
ncbi:MAG: replication protein RepA [Candidatus Aenigmarchaeota archaeon]|nr:replication protein RepA [Candidatus Aenigmarchaeota archaeon]